MDCSSDVTDFTKADDLSDIVLLVEGHQLHANRIILATSSPVWKTMFASDFREKGQDSITLPGKRYEDVHELLRCIYPSVRRPVYDKNVLQILPLADEYQMTRLKSECEQLLISKLQIEAPPKQYMQYLLEAQRYNLSSLLKKAVQLAAVLPLQELEARVEHSELESETLMSILRSRVAKLETEMTERVKRTDECVAKAETLEQKMIDAEKDKVKVMEKNERQLSLIVQQVTQMHNAFELKGPEARCSDQVHMYGERDLACSRCNKQTQAYVSSIYSGILSELRGIHYPRISGSLAASSASLLAPLASMSTTPAVSAATSPGPSDRG